MINYQFLPLPHRLTFYDNRLLSRVQKPRRQSLSWRLVRAVIMSCAAVDSLPFVQPNQCILLALKVSWVSALSRSCRDRHRYKITRQLPQGPSARTRPLKLPRTTYKLPFEEHLWAMIGSLTPFVASNAREGVWRYDTVCNSTAPRSYSVIDPATGMRSPGWVDTWA
jgi:hypothetical protein